MTYARSGGRKAAAGQIARDTAPMLLSELKPQPVQWLWPKRIPLGAITVVAGEPGLGKSLLTLNLAARLSRGELLPDPGNTLLLSAEDAREQTVLPRLIVEKADLDRLMVPPKAADGLELPLHIPTDIDQIRDLAIAGKVRMIVVDPLTAHLSGRVNSNSDKSIRGALAPLAALAEENDLAVVLVAHLNKGEGADALHRIGGSIALPAAARSVLLLARDPDDPDGTGGSLRVLAQVKSNLAALQGSLSYQVESREIAELEDPVIFIRELGPSSYSADELLALDRHEARSKRAEARIFLEAELADGVRPTRELLYAAKQLDISPTTLERAKKDMGAKSVKLGLGGWGWESPSNEEQDAEVAAA